MKCLFIILICLVSFVSAEGKYVFLTGENLFPEGISYWPARQTFYVGSAGNGSIQTVCLGGKAKIIQTAGTDGRTSTLGVKVDQRRDLFWVVDGAAVYIYQLSSNVLLKKLPLLSIVSVEKSALNDIALDAQGNAYITDSFNPHIIKVHSSTFSMEVWCKVDQIPFGNQNDFPYNLNGIVLVKNRYLYMVKTNDGTLWKIDIFSKKVSQIALSEPVTKGDGLVLVGDRLYIIRNFENTISYINLESKKKIKKVKNINTEGSLNIPTTGFYVKYRRELIVVNSQFGSNKPEKFRLTRVSLKKKK